MVGCVSNDTVSESNLFAKCRPVPFFVPLMPKNPTRIPTCTFNEETIFYLCLSISLMGEKNSSVIVKNASCKKPGNSEYNRVLIWNKMITDEIA